MLEELSLLTYARRESGPVAALIVYIKPSSVFRLLHKLANGDEN